MKDIIKIDGLTFAVTLEPDDFAGEPWGEEETYGAVSDWTKRRKAPGERVAFGARYDDKRFYDFAAAVKAARAAGLSGVDAARGVEREFRRIRDWCEDRWGYVVVVVTLLDTEGRATRVCDAIGGVEDDDESCIAEVAAELAEGLTRSIGGRSELVTTTRIRKAA